MTQIIYKPLPDGVYIRNGSVISVDAAGNHNQLSVSEHKRHMRVWVATLPDDWRLCEGAEVEGAPAGEPMTDGVRDAIFDALTAAIALMTGDNQERFIEAREWLTGQPDARRYLTGNIPTEANHEL